MANLIKCPKCGEQIEITSALKAEISEQIKIEAKEEVRKELEEKNSLETADLKRILEEKDKKLAEFREQELKLREEKRKIEEEKKELVIEVQRQVDEGIKKAEEAAFKKADEEHRLKDLEKDKRLSDALKANEELNRKLQQGSQQTQGEVLELDLENTLREAFPQDLVEPVGKGIKGADIKQIVRSPRGFVCGVILWESKTTKAWVDSWLTKLKDDLRSEKADIPVLVTTIFPKEVNKGFGLIDNVWVVSFDHFVPLAIALRKNLLDVGYQKALSVNQGRKADLIFEFVTGNEFRQQVEALVEVYMEMKDQIDKEKLAYERLWKSREGQIKRLISSTINIYAKAAGLVGSSMPQIKGLELLEIEDSSQ